MISAYQEGNVSNDYHQLAELLVGKRTDQFAIYITHDIDWLNLLHPYSILNSVRATISKHKWFSPKQLLQNDLLLRNIEQLLQLEKQLGVHSIYFLGASAEVSLGRYAIRYGINSGLYKELIALLQQYQMPIGLHSSKNAFQKNKLQQERDRLCSLTNTPILAHRSHYVPQLSQHDFAQLEATGFLDDFGSGSSKKIGFKNGFPGIYKPLQTQEPSKLKLVPMMLMDNVFFSRPYHEVIFSFKTSLQKLKVMEGSACVAFHPENMLLQPQLYSYFEEILHLCKEERAILNPPLTLL
jgi:hypothetical protein